MAVVLKYIVLISMPLALKLMDIPYVFEIFEIKCLLNKLITNKLH